MKKIITASLILIFNLASAQKTKLIFFSTYNFNSSDKELFIKIRNEILGKNEKKSNEYQFSIQSALNEEVLNVDKSSDLNLIDNNSFNSIYSDKNEEINFIRTKRQEYDATFEFKINSTLNLNFENSSNEYEYLLKWIKKNSGDNLLIIWNNGYRPFKFSSENIIREISNKSKEGSLEQITPTITKPKHNEALRPDESHYYFEFDSVGIFPSYKIQVYWKKPLGTDFYNNTMYDSILFLEDCLQFTRIEDFKMKKNSFSIALFASDDSKCKVAIKEEFLADICYKLEQKIINTDGVPDHDDTCTPCKYECLYQKKFSLIIKGCSPGIKQEIIPETTTNFFLFQCAKSNN
jgi:hypothetical protein